MESDNIDNEKLLSEIESLDDENEESSNNLNKNNKGSIIFIIVLLGLTILYFGGTYYNSFFEKANDNYYEEQIDSYLEQEEKSRNNFEEQKKNISIKQSFFSANKELIAVLENNNAEIVTDLLVEVIFYDGENKPIEIDSDKVSIIEKNSKCYVKFLDTPENFERYEFLISKEYYWYDNLEYVTDQISYEIEKNDEYTNLIVKNNYSKKVSEVCMQIVYYDKNNVVIDVEDVTIWDLKKNKSKKEELYLSIWDNDTYEPIDYNRYEINLIGAYIY